MKIKNRLDDFSSKELGEILWKYNILDTQIKQSDILIVLGSNDIAVAEYAADLFHRKLSSLIIASGGVAHDNDLLATGWNKPEALVFSERMIELGVPKDFIIIESESKNTGENFIKSRTLLQNIGKEISSGIIVQKPFMERRALATAEKQWSEISWCVTSPDITFDDFMGKFNEESLINILVGDTWRVIEYYLLGFQTKQEMPDNVYAVMNELINRGYSKHIPK